MEHFGRMPYNGYKEPESDGRLHLWSHWLKTNRRGRTVLNADLFLVVKAGFMGFGVSLGAQMLVFYVAGALWAVSRKYFRRVFVLAAVVSFLAVYALLHYKIRVVQNPEALLFLSGCVGGWLGGIFSGLTHVKPFLLGLCK